MKKIFVLFVMMAAMAIPSQAQFQFGLKGGLNLTKVTGNAKDALKNKAGFFVGPTVKYTLPVVGLSFDASALYDQRNMDVEGADKSIKVQSIQVPINVRYGIGLSSVVNLFAFAGPQFGFNLGSKDKSFTFNNAQNIVGGWTLKSSNLSANVGIGATILGHLQATVNYNFALGKTGDFGVGTATDIITGKMKTNSWQVSAAYLF